MEILPKIADAIIRNIQGAIRTSETKFDIPYIYQVIHEARASILKATFTKERRIQSSWTQIYIPDFNADLQDNDCVVKFEVPAPVALDNKIDGFLYVGMIEKNCAFRKAVSRAELSNINRHRTGRKAIKYLYSEGIMEVYANPLIKEMMIDGIFANPTVLPTYNIRFSEYPIDDASLALLKTAVAGLLGVPAQTPADKKQDNFDAEPAIQQQQQQQR